MRDTRPSTTNILSYKLMPSLIQIPTCLQRSWKKRTCLGKRAQSPQTLTVKRKKKNKTPTQERDNQNPLIRTIFTTRTHFLIRVEAFDKRRPELNLPRRRHRPGGPQQSKTTRSDGQLLSKLVAISSSPPSSPKTARICNAYDTTVLSFVGLEPFVATKTVNSSLWTTP